MEYEQIMTALRNADAAGDTEAATRLAAMAREARAAAPEPSSSSRPKWTENIWASGEADTWGEKIGNVINENLIGRGAVDTPGERLGELIRGGGAATARGMADVPAIPANLAQLGAMGYEKATGAELGSSAMSRGLAALPEAAWAPLQARCQRPFNPSVVKSFVTPMLMKLWSKMAALPVWH